MIHHPCILGGPQRQARGGKSEVLPHAGEKKQKWLPLPCLLRGPEEGGNATSPLHSRGSRTRSEGRNIGSSSQSRQKKIGSGCLTPTLLGAQKRAEMLRHPCIVGDPQRQARGGKLEVVPNKGEQNWKWLPHPCLLGGPKEDGNAMSPLHSRGSPTPSAGRKIRSGPQQRGTKLEVAASPLPSWEPRRGRKCYVTPEFSGVPNAKRGEENQKWSPTKGEKKQKWQPYPCLLGAQQRAEILRHPLHSWGSPTPSTGRKIRSGP